MSNLIIVAKGRRQYIAIVHTNQKVLPKTKQVSIWKVK
jgi:hypothetical protein